MEAGNKMSSEGPVNTLDGKPMTPKSIAAALNDAKNHVKHSAAPASYDVRAEACSMLWRASSNYEGLRQAGAPLPVDHELMDRLDDECMELVLKAR